MKNFTLWWIAWILFFGVLEYRAIRTKEHGDTLSENVWALLRPYAGTRALMGGLLGWLTWHFLFYQGTGYGWRDAVSIGAGAIAGVIGGRFSRPKPEEAA